MNLTEANYCASVAILENQKVIMSALWKLVGSEFFEKNQFKTDKCLKLLNETFKNEHGCSLF